MVNSWQDLFNKIQEAKPASSARQEIFMNLALEAEVLLIHAMEKQDNHQPTNAFLETFLKDISTGCSPEQATRLYIKAARWAEKNGSHDFAIQLYRQAGEQAHKTENWKDLTKSLEELGEIFRVTGEFKQAKACQEEALEISMEKNLALSEAHALNNLGTIEIEMGNIEPAQEYFQKALSIAESTQDSLLIGHLYNNLGVLLCITGHPDKAYSEFNRALPYREQSGNVKGMIETQHNLGKSLVDTNRPVESEDYVNAALSSARQSCEKVLVADILLTRADLMLRLSLYEIALQSAKEALNMHRNLNSPLGTADAMRLCGTALHHLDKHDEAIQMLHHSRKICEEYKHPYGIAETCEMIMILEYKSGTVKAAEEAFNSAVKAYSQLNNSAAIQRLEKQHQTLIKKNQSK